MTRMVVVFVAYGNASVDILFNSNSVRYSRRTAISASKSTLIAVYIPNPPVSLAPWPNALPRAHKNMSWTLSDWSPLSLVKIHPLQGHSTPCPTRLSPDASRLLHRYCTKSLFSKSGIPIIFRCLTDTPLLIQSYRPSSLLSSTSGPTLIMAVPSSSTHRPRIAFPHPSLSPTKSTISYSKFWPYQCCHRQLAYQQLCAPSAYPNNKPPELKPKRFSTNRLFTLHLAGDINLFW